MGTTGGAQGQAARTAQLGSCHGALHDLHRGAKGCHGMQPLTGQSQFATIAPQPLRVGPILHLPRHLGGILHVAAESADESVSPTLMLLET